MSYLKTVVQPFAVRIVATQLALPLSPTERDFQNYEKMSRGVVEWQLVRTCSSGWSHSPSCCLSGRGWTLQLPFPPIGDNHYDDGEMLSILSHVPGIRPKYLVPGIRREKIHLVSDPGSSGCFHKCASTAFTWVSALLSKWQRWRWRR